MSGQSMVGCFRKIDPALNGTPQFVLTLAILPILCAPGRAAEDAVPPATATRSAVPLICTETQISARTRVRGTAVIVDAKGVILTAAHVVFHPSLFCTLTVLVPDDEWSNAREYRAFSVRQCAIQESLDVAICRIEPVERKKDWAYVRAAKLGQPLPEADSAITITGFWGWGMLPVPRRGKLKSHMLYKRQDGVYCDFSTDIVGFEGMSGSPVVTDQGYVIGLVTTAGIKKFSGTSFGISIERAAGFLRANGLTLLPDLR